MRVWKLFFLFALSAFVSSAVEGDRFRWNGLIASGGALEIKGLNGGIHAEPSSGKEVEVVARKDGGRSDPASVHIDVVEHDGGVTLCAVYPSDGSRPNECKPGSGGHLSASHNDVKVEFTVRVPSGVRLVARTVNGSVDANGLQSDVEAHTVNGNVHFNAKGSAQASTVNGSIIGSITRLSDAARDFSTVNGSITLEIPPGANADIHASTVNGHISTDFPLTVRGRMVVGKSLQGTIGSGGHELKLNTVNGSIHLRQGASI